MSYIKETTQGIGMMLQVVIWGAVVIVGFSALSFGIYKLSAPAYEQVRYDTFKNSQAYNDGMLRDLFDLKREYEKADEEHKAADKALIIHRFEVYDINRLPAELQAFYYSLR